VADPDQPVIAAQLGRPLRARSQVVTRCHLGLPVVVMVPPVLDDGTPFPTLYWLTCPLAVRRVGRLEAAGGVKAMAELVAADPALASGLEEAHQRYRRQRNEQVPSGLARVPTGGIGGSGGGIKCLHAHYADHAAGNPNPVGGLIAADVEPLNCAVGCVEAGRRNPEWREPAHEEEP
jgi:hypothetical protein